ncbi:unnamed protein product [Auanema sp. JU1783]|nr:unnamed protein product [Auanema sp. JU1783]
MSGRRLPRSLSAPVFHKNSRRLMNLLLFKIQDMRTAVSSLSNRVVRRERRRRSAENGHNNSSAPMSGSQNEWQLAFDNVIYDEAGREAFAKFLSTEYSDENIDFWWAAEQLKVLHRNGERQKFEETVLSMFDSFIATEGGYSINIDHDTREDIFAKVVNMDPSTFPPNIFDKAQAHVYRLMEKDCFSRFVHTDGYKQVAKKLSLPQNFGSNGRTTSPH